MNQKPWLDSYPPHVKWNQKFKGKPLHNLIDDTAAIIPQNVALDFMGKTWTYGDVEKAVKAACKSFQDMGTTNRKGKLRMGKQLNADYSLSGSITATKEEYDRVDHNEALFIVRIDYQLVDNETGEIIEADTAEGRDKRKLIRLPSGKFIGGFNPSDSKQLKDAIDNAGLNALKVVGNKIGNKLPVGGRISGFKGQRFAMESGHEDGFMGDQIVILYGSDMGIDMPFAVGEVHPGKYKTSGKIIRWSNDPDVQDIISGIKSDKFYFNKNELYAVSNGMPLPPAWDKNYRD